MKEERLMILKMVEEGKVSADEAVKLLNAVNGTKNDKYFDFEDKVNKAAKSMDEFAKDVKVKLTGVAKEVEPKVRKTTQAVIEKTGEVVDEFSKFLRETISNLECDEKDCNCDDCKSEEDKEDDNTPKEN